MERLTVDIPDDLALELHQYQDRIREVLALGLLQIKAHEALALYARGVVSLERAAEIAGLSRQEMVHQARAQDIQPRWTEEMAQAELA